MVMSGEVRYGDVWFGEAGLDTSGSSGFDSHYFQYQKQGEVRSGLARFGLVWQGGVGLALVRWGMVGILLSRSK